MKLVANKGILISNISSETDKFTMKTKTLDSPLIAPSGTVSNCMQFIEVTTDYFGTISTRIVSGIFYIYGFCYRQTSSAYSITISLGKGNILIEYFVLST